MDSFVMSQGNVLLGEQAQVELFALGKLAF